MKSSIKMLPLLCLTTGLLTGFTCCEKTGNNQPASSVETKGASKPSVRAENVITHIASIEEFEALITKPTIVKFTGDYCPACKKIEPLYQKIAQEYHEAYQFAEIDAPKFRSLAEKYSIRGIPTFLFFNNKEASVRIVGASITYDEFVSTIKRAFN